jgi:hypothetical protein
MTTMRNEDRKLERQLLSELGKYSSKVKSLPGIEDDAALNTLVFQIIESVRRIRFIKEVAKRDISRERKNPKSELFDPIRAAILEKRAANFEEACWLVFLFTHFGKNLRSGYRLLRDVYGKLGQGSQWTWSQTKRDPFGFRQWLDANLDTLRSETVHRAFGNHRKYQSLDPWKPNGTGAAVESYIAWVTTFGSHKELFESASHATGDDPEKSFHWLYKSMKAVSSFGRTARFDYLSMMGKLDLANIRPDSVYFGSATGPVDGARLLFHGSIQADASTKQLETLADQLAEFLQLDKQVMEDSLCNWQKSPTEPVGFRG